MTLQAAAAEKTLSGEERVDALLDMRRRGNGNGYIGPLLGDER